MSTEEPQLNEITTAWVKWYHNLSSQICTDRSENDGGYVEHNDGWHEGRQTAYLLGKFLAVRCWSERLGLDPAEIDPVLRRSTAFICRRQSADGRIDLGGSYSPNEVGFTLPALVEGYKGIVALPGNPLADIAALLKKYLLLGADAVVEGQAYTANHRWTAAAAPLAAVHSLWPDARYLKKIENYLADGFDMNADGNWFEERSPNYNIVANNGVMALADYLNRPELLDVVKRNLDFLSYFLQPNGEADSSFSHRQDRGAADRMAISFAQARRVALRTGDGHYSALAHLAFQRGDRGLEDLRPLLFELDQQPGIMPGDKPLPTDFEKVFPASHLARVRRGKTAVTLACDEGNHFYDAVLQTWGGPRRSDDWFHLQQGEVVLQTIHLSGGGMNNMQPHVLQQEAPGQYSLTGEVTGWEHTLHFRPGWPKFEMRWDWKHAVDVNVQEKEIDLAIQSTAGSSLIASLGFMIRPGAEIFEGDKSLGLSEPGRKLPLQGGLPLRITKGGSELEITGLPPARHRRLLDGGPSIPSGIAGQCTNVFVGLAFPVDVHFKIKLIK